ncbi:amino acid ABC transporter permease [Humitalea sp. 24SJ18S-53]|uniref:amino acid ABC transporter permease n=1 Tax=Humitalea sp. 24SJ18S-53 TaxID=3422307 RepID=UPI003D665FEB
MMAYQWNFGLLLNYLPLLGHGIMVTLAFTLGTIVLGLIIGLAIGMARLSRLWIVNAPLILLTEVFRCTPPLVQLVWFYYALPVLIDVQIPGTLAATLVLSFYVGAFYSEIFRGGIISIEKGQWEAARALGLRPWSMMWKVILPQAIRRMVPPFMNQSVIQLKTTSLVSTIAVPDLLYNGSLITAETYRPLEVYTVIALVYFCLLFPATRAVQWYERRLAAKR